MAQAVQPIRRAQSGVTLERSGGSSALLTSAVLTLGLIGLVLRSQGLGSRSWLVVLRPHRCFPAA
jgi:hypothetical protein